MTLDLDRDLRLAQEDLQDTLEQYWFRRGDPQALGWPLAQTRVAMGQVTNKIRAAQAAGDPRAERMLAADAELRATMEEMAAAGRPILENPGLSGLLARLRVDVEAELSSSGGSGRTEGLLGRIAVGLLPTGSVNAVTRPAPRAESSFVVLLDDGVFVLQNLGAKALARCFPLGTEPAGPRWLFDEADVMAELNRSPKETIGRFSEAILALAATGEASAAEQYLPDPGWVDLSHVLTRGGELFVLAHEYGHVQRGHLAEQRAARAEEPGEAPVIARAWEREHEADVTGLEVAVAVLGEEGIPPGLAVAAAGLALELQHAFELVLWTLKDGDLASAQKSLASWYSRPGATHPPPPSRRDRLRQVVERDWGDEAELALTLWDTCSATTGLLATRSLQLAELMHHRHGTRPSERWQPMLAIS